MTFGGLLVEKSILGFLRYCYIYNSTGLPYGGVPPLKGKPSALILSFSSYLGFPSDPLLPVAEPPRTIALRQIAILEKYIFFIMVKEILKIGYPSCV